MSGGVNLYVYSDYSPINYIDPNGWNYCATQAFVDCIIAAEGSGNTFVSSANATGKMQITPGAVDELKRTKYLSKKAKPNLKNQATNIRVGTLYLNYLLDRYDGDVREAALAYTAGTGIMSRAYDENTGYLEPKKGYPASNSYVDKVMNCLRKRKDSGVSECGCAKKK
jgi:soluble lytic murein transglycosylase-like protein